MEEKVQPGPEQVELEQGDRQTPQEQVLHDDENPYEVLKSFAQQLNVADAVIMSQKELQSYVDQMVTKAIKTREENLRKEQERRLLEEQGKFQELLRLERKEALEKHKTEVLTSYGLQALSELINVGGLVDKPLGQAMEELDGVLSSLKQFIDTLVEERLKQRLGEFQKSTNVPAVSKPAVQTVHDLIAERLKSYYER